MVVAFTPMVTNFFVWLPSYHTYYCVEGLKYCRVVCTNLLFTSRLPPGVMLKGVFLNTPYCTHPTVGSWLQRCVMSEGMCFKGCISGCAVKSSGVWEATHPFTTLPPGVMLNGVFYSTSSWTHSAVGSWLPRVMSGHRCIDFLMA